KGRTVWEREPNGRAIGHNGCCLHLPNLLTKECAVSEHPDDRMPKELVPEFNAINWAIVQLQGQWMLYRCFLKPEHLELMNKTARDAFRLIAVAVRNEITMAHGRLLDPPESYVKDEGLVPNLSLTHLVKVISPRCPSEVASRLEDMLNDAKAHCKPMLK